MITDLAAISRRHVRTGLPDQEGCTCGQPDCEQLVLLDEIERLGRVDVERLRGAMRAVAVREEKFVSVYVGWADQIAAEYDKGESR